MSIADELKKLAELRDSGVISQNEFEAQKEKILDTDPHNNAAEVGKADGEKAKSKSWLLWLILLPLLIFVFFAVVGSKDPNTQARIKERDAISLCWSEQSRKSNSPANSRFIASACEKMERDFHKKWGFAP